MFSTEDNLAPFMSKIFSGLLSWRSDFSPGAKDFTTSETKEFIKKFLLSLTAKLMVLISELKVLFWIFCEKWKTILNSWTSSSGWTWSNFSSTSLGNERIRTLSWFWTW